MGQHGFARDMEFTLESQASDTIWFKLESNDETLAKFPFAFTLKIGYELSDNAVKVLWNVTNSGNDTLPFSIGAHPAFNCPIGADSSKTGYQISFGKFADATKDAANMTALSQIHHHGNTRDTGLAITEDIVMPLTDGRVTITPDFFDRCTYMIEGNQANSVSLIDASISLSKKHGSVRFSLVARYIAISAYFISAPSASRLIFSRIFSKMSLAMVSGFKSPLKTTNSFHLYV